MSDPAEKNANKRAEQASKVIVTGTALAALGIMMSLTPIKEGAGLVTLVGLATSIYGLHRLGRSGRRAPATEHKS